MSTYIVVRQRDQPAYRIDIVEDNGNRRSVLGFTTCAEAEAWIQADKKLDQTYRRSSPD
jgi:hypothetical protein